MTALGISDEDDEWPKWGCKAIIFGRMLDGHSGSIEGISLELSAK
jgi:hypothetical protein